jgi:putative transposase
MGATFSQDLRERVITAMASGEFTRHEVAENLQVSVWYVDDVMKRYRRTGSREAKPWNGGPRRVLSGHREWIRALVSQTPDITLEELCTRLKKDKRVKASPSMMCRELADMALPLKKSRSMTASVTRTG